MGLFETLATPEEALCVQIALTVLPDSALNAIITFLDTATASLNYVHTIIEAEILNLDIILTPLVIEKNKLLQIQQTVVAQFKILDQALVVQCRALGSLNQTVLSSIDFTTEAITNTLNMINMKEALKIQLQHQGDIITDSIAFLGWAKGVFQNVLQTRTQTKIVGQLPGLVHTI